MRDLQHKPNPESGAALVTTLMAAALFGIGIVLISKMVTRTTQLRSAVELRADAALLKKNLLNAVDCKAVPPCQGNQFRTLKDYDGDILVDAQGQTKFGVWTVRAQCQPDRTIEVRVALLDSKDNPAKDPVKGTLLDWQAPQGILIEKGILCGVLAPGAGSGYTVQFGPRCLPAQGTCPSMPESSTDPNASPIMCCDDGRDALKPTCPAPMQEFVSYWDRQDDWGMAGQWVVLCQ